MNFENLISKLSFRLLVFFYLCPWFITSLNNNVSPNEDFYAFPQFETVFQNTPVPPQKNLDDVIVLPNGSSFWCQMPPLKIESNSENDSTKQELRTQEAIIQNALRLLAPLQNNCLRMNQEWWSYEFCFDKYAKQYHQVGKIVYLTFILGNYIPKQSIPKLESHGRFRYLTFDFTSGTKCDVTNEPRSIKIRFQCSLNASPYIESVKETSICNYLMNVNLPQLCEDPYFLSPEILLTPRKIKCHPILSEQDYLEWHKGNKIPLPSPPPKLQMPKRENKYMLLQNDKPSSQLQTPLKNIAIKIMKELSELNLENDKGKGNSPPRFLIVDGEDFPLVENTAPSSRDKSKEKNEMDPSENEHEEISFKVVTYENNNEEMKEFENVEEEKQEKQDKDSKERVEL